MSEINNVINFNVPGGLIGLIAGDEAKKLNKVLKAENANGWRYRSHTPNSFNLISVLVNLVFLWVTLTLWSPGARNLLVLDRME